MAFSRLTRQKITEHEFFEIIEPFLNHIRTNAPQSTPKLEEFITTRFPKSCSSCHSSFKTEQELIANTVKLGPDYRDVCYRIKGKFVIYRYRNCPAPCLNTLAYTVKDRRDQSKAGDERRMQFKGLKGTMKDRFVLRDKASHDMTLFLMRAILSGATEE